MARAPVEEAAHRDKNGNTPDATMGSINDLAVEYGRRIEALLEELGARGPAKGAGELLDQVKHLIDPEDQRKLRWFLKLRNKVVHGRPPHMPMPTREQVERAGRAAVEALERTLAARRDQKAEPNGWQAEPPPGPVYRIRDGACQVWVGPGGVWVAAASREVLQKRKLDVETALVLRFPRLAVRAVWLAQRPGQAARQEARLEAWVRYGKGTIPIRNSASRPLCTERRLTPEEVSEAVRLIREGLLTARAASVRRVRPEGVPATFYVGRAGVLAVAEHPLIAERESRRVWQESAGAISAIPAVLSPELKEPWGRVAGVLALRDEGAIRDYLRQGNLLDEDEVDQVAGWLRNRRAPVPTLRDKGQAPPALLVELVPPAPPPRPSLLRRVWRGLSWRALFLPELVFFALVAVLFAKPAEDFWAWLLVGVLVLRFFALFGDDPLGWKRWTLLGVGALELAFVGVAAADFAARPTELAKHWDAVPTLVIGFLIPGLISFFRGLYLYWRHRHL